jgi:uncharacterized protein
MVMKIRRREFLKSLAVLAAGLRLSPTALATASHDKLGAVLPLRRLGKTGKQVTCLGLGGFHVGWIDQEKTAEAVIEAAMEEGVRFFDTAENYGNGLSEERYGRYLTPKYRESIFLMTKTAAPDAATAWRHLEGSLRRMKTDRIDLWQLHSLSSPEDAASRLDRGLLEAALRAKAEGKVLHIGFTGHASPYAHQHMLENSEAREAFETCLIPINPVDAGAKYSFIDRVLPALAEADYGVLAMKTLADGRFFKEKTMNGRVNWETDTPIVPDVLTIEECIFFALSLPVSVLITGAEKPAFIREKAAMVRRFEALAEVARLALVEKVAKFAELGEVEYYKNNNLRG